MVAAAAVGVAEALGMQVHSMSVVDDPLSVDASIESDAHDIDVQLRLDQRLTSDFKLLTVSAHHVVVVVVVALVVVLVVAVLDVATV